MNPLVLLALWIVLISTSHSHSAKNSTLKRNGRAQTTYPALVVNLTYIVSKNASLDVPCIIACPAFTKREMEFNRQVSITGKCLFLRNYHESRDRVALNVCEKPFESGMVHNLRTDRYEIGYEIYFEASKIKSEDRANNPATGGVKVNLKPGDYYSYETSKEPASSFVVHHKNDNTTKTFFTDGSRTLVFYWHSELTIASTGYNKHIKLNENFRAGSVRSTCQDYTPNQKKAKLYLLPQQSEPNSMEEWKRCPYGDVVQSQLIPLWYFPTNSGKFASCTHMNMIPVWKNIAENQLKKVDLYLQALIHHLLTPDSQQHSATQDWKVNQMIFGVSEWTTIGNTLSQSKYVYLNSPNSEMIPMPKLIYRLIDVEYFGVVYNAIVVVHNDPTGQSKGVRLCGKESEVPGWDAIKNDASSTGLTYVCQYKVRKFLPSRLHVPMDDPSPHPLQPNRIPVLFSGGHGQLGRVYLNFSDHRDLIDKKFRNLLSS